MATISFTIPTAQVKRVLDGFCYQHGYQDELPDPVDSMKTIPNPETKAVFIKRKIKEIVKHSVKSWEATQAAEASRKMAIDSVEAEVTIQD